MSIYGVEPPPPMSWRNADHLQPISLQDALAGKVKMCHAIVTGSKSRTKSRRMQVPKKFSGFEVIHHGSRSTGATIKFGNSHPGPDPANEEIKIASDVLEALPEFGLDDAVIRERIVVHDVPREFQKTDLFQADPFGNLYELQRANARNVRKFRGITGVRILDVYGSLLKPQLTKAGLAFDHHMLRSQLETTWMKPCRLDMGWRNIAPEHQTLMRALSADLKTRSRFWLDTAIPYRRNFQIGGTAGEFYLYRFLKAQELTVFKNPAF